MFCFRTPSFWALAMRNEVESHEWTEFMVVPCLLALWCEVGMAVLFDQSTDCVMRIPPPCAMFKLYTRTTTTGARYVWMIWLCYHHRARYVWIICLYCHHRARWFPLSCAMICMFHYHQRISLWMIYPYHCHLLHKLITSAMRPYVQWYSCVAIIIIPYPVKPVNQIITIMLVLHFICAIYLCLCLYHMRVNYMPLTLSLVRIDLISFALNSYINGF